MAPHASLFSGHAAPEAAIMSAIPKRRISADAAKKLFASLGGKMTAFYLTMGHYDLVFVADFPNDDAAAKALLAVASQGNIHTQTLRAFSEDEYRKLIASLP
ncbi:MAG: GYD family protein [Acidobacteria bacterium]|nr:MAG: GYD family protein [Acidobacteriota bacterium]